MSGATTFSDLWAELKAEAAAAIAKLKTDTVAFEHTIVPIIEADVVAVLSQFQGLAVQLVLQFAGGAFAAVSGREKLGAVVKGVYYAAVAAGKNVAIQDVQLLAQQAYDSVATQLGASPAK